MRNVYFLMLFVVSSVFFITSCSNEGSKPVPKKEVKRVEKPKKKKPLTELEKKVKENRAYWNLIRTTLNNKGLSVNDGHATVSIVFDDKEINTSSEVKVLEGFNTPIVLAPLSFELGRFNSGILIEGRLSNPDTGTSKKNEDGFFDREFYLSEVESFFSEHGIVIGVLNLEDNLLVNNLTGLANYDEDRYMVVAVFDILIEGNFLRDAFLKVLFQADGSISGIDLRLNHGISKEMVEAARNSKDNIISVEEAKDIAKDEVIKRISSGDLVVDIEGNKIAEDSPDFEKLRDELLSARIYASAGYRGNFSYRYSLQKPMVIKEAPYVVWPFSITFKERACLVFINARTGEIALFEFVPPSYEEWGPYDYQEMYGPMFKMFPIK